MHPLEFARGPGLYVAIAAFGLGTAWRPLDVQRLPRRPHRSPLCQGGPSSGVAALQALGRGMSPRRDVGQATWVTTFIGYVFPIGLALTCFGCAPQLAFIERRIDLPWPSLPDGVMYVAAAATSVSLLLALWMRLGEPVRRESRKATTASREPSRASCRAAYREARPLAPLVRALGALKGCRTPAICRYD